MPDKPNVAYFRCIQCKIRVAVSMVAEKNGRILLLAKCEQCENILQFDIENMIASMLTNTSNTNPSGGNGKGN